MRLKRNPYKTEINKFNFFIYEHKYGGIIRIDKGNKIIKSMIYDFKEDDFISAEQLKDFKLIDKI